MRTATIRWVPPVLLLAALLPFQADGAPQCFNASTSLGATTRNPSNGDEQFFSLPVGPANIMFILDSSGSMNWLPQCGDTGANWGGAPLFPGMSACPWPTLPAIPAATAASVGTCDLTGNPELAWMNNVLPVPLADLSNWPASADPGHTASALGLTDAPPWGTGCAGNACLFNRDGYYIYGRWTETTANQYDDCTAYTTGGNPTPIQQQGNTNVTADVAACRACMNSEGFYFFQTQYLDTSGNWQITPIQLRFRGAWLNANPHRVVTARKVIKQAVWMDPATPSNLDSVRFGLSIIRNGGAVVVPLGPDKTNSFPASQANFVQTRQYIINSLNNQIATVGSLASGATPLATTLFHVGQYFTSAGVYGSAFGGSYESASFAQSVDGLADAPWAQSNPNQCSICWGCQQNSIILVTDGSPNNESTMPAAITSYDDATYHNPQNCGPGNTCTAGDTCADVTATPVYATPVRPTAITAVATTCTPGALPNRCRCPGSTTNHANGYFCGYYCGTTRRSQGYVCGYQCPGDTTNRAQNYTCYTTCPGDPVQHPANYVCYATCPGDTTQHAAGYSCGCNCPGDVTNYPAGTVCPASMCCSPSDSDGVPSRLPRIASWLYANDLRTDLSVSDPQKISTYTISFGLPTPPAPNVNPALQILQATANMGGGRFWATMNSSELAAAVTDAVNDVVQRATSFSAPAAASLSTLRTVAVEAILTRFKPNDTPSWEGHVFEGMLFDEFANGCDPTRPAGAGSQPAVSCGGKTVSANFNGDADASGHAICTGVFLVDADCDEVSEDAKTGAFLKKGLGNTPANMFWDAGLVLSHPEYPAGHPQAGAAVPGYRAANARTIYSVLGGVVTPLDAANAAAFAPYLNLDPTWCAQKLALWGICGGTLAACTSVTDQCAKAVIDFVRGWDVTDNDGDLCGAPGRGSNSTACAGGADGEERIPANDNRTASPVFWKLGDIFHSAPVLVRPPSDEILCGTGFENQCTATIFSPKAFDKQTQNPADYLGLDGKPADAYEAWRLQLDVRDRRQVVLVGANDGMLHAFDAGVPDATKPRNAFGVRPYTKGTGEELWGFVPPDLLPRLKDLTQAHQYMVDGSVMVKDIWVDGSRPVVNEPADKVLVPPNNRKEQGEFHTIAVITERAGGTQYTALDVTDPASPKFLWAFPPPGSDDARYMGQSWTDFAPGPPPIGPVRLALRAGEPDPTGRGFAERWIVAVNGGYDPTLTRGRAVWLVDAWTGQVVWRFTDDDFKSQQGYNQATSMFPVPSGISAVDIGDSTVQNGDRDGFFDTATWGDLGGNLFVARFWNPGTPALDTSADRVTNWVAARAFEQQRRADNAQQAAGRFPFFYMPESVFDSATGTLRTYLGSGNRERAMSVGQECNPDNLLGCCAAGCTSVTAVTRDDFGTCAQESRFTCNGGQLILEPTTSNCGTQVLACGSFTSTAELHITCGAGSIDVARATLTCDANGICSTPAGSPANLGTASLGSLPAASTKPRFYGIWTYGGPAEKRFDSTAGGGAALALAEAQAFEANRFTDVTYAGCTGPSGGACGLVDVTGALVTYDPLNPALATVTCSGAGPCSASSADAGWFYQYGDSCPLGGECSPPPPWWDEKTGAGATTLLGCVSWASFRPVGAGSGTDPCTGNVGTPQSYGYLADYLSGTPGPNCGTRYSTGGTSTYVRAIKRDTVSTPNAQTIRVVVSPSGEVKYQGLEFPTGSSGGMVTTTTYGTRSDTAEMMYWLEVPRDLHACRHDPVASVSSCQ